MALIVAYTVFFLAPAAPSWTPPSGTWPGSPGWSRTCSATRTRSPPCSPGL